MHIQHLLYVIYTLLYLLYYAGQKNKVCGFHIVFDKEQPHDNAKKFAVKLLTLSRHNRHLDSMFKEQFWDQLKDNHKLASQIREKAKLADTARA